MLSGLIIFFIENEKWLMELVIHCFATCAESFSLKSKELFLNQLYIVLLILTYNANRITFQRRIKSNRTMNAYPFNYFKLRDF